MEGVSSVFAAGCRLPVVLSALPGGACWSCVYLYSQYVCVSLCVLWSQQFYMSACVCGWLHACGHTDFYFSSFMCVCAHLSVCVESMCVCAHVCVNACLCDEMRLDFLQGCSSMEATWSSRNDGNVGTVIRFAVSITTTTFLPHCRNREEDQGRDM